MRNRWWAAPILAGGAALLAACGSSGAASTGASTPAAGGTSPATSQQSGTNTATATTTIMTHSTSKGTVLATARGRTIYWFAIDTASMSNCTGSCATYWPPVLGKAAAAAGTTLMHGFGTITRTDGKVQATYDGHPLYTYAADSAPGQISGDGLNVSGGLWWAMTPSGAKLAASPSGSSSSSSSGGGYGY
jgi:predicted lipoprotein with Yx(FWY)xxD motif